MNIYGKNIENRELSKYIGSAHQVMGLKKYTLSDGFAEGVQCVDVKTGAGLEYTVVLSRALDISHASFKGASLTHISPAGEVNPAFFNPAGNEWLRSFGIGLLTSVGIDQAGGPNEHNGNIYGQHGRLSNLPAANVALHEDFTDKGFEMSVSGEMTQWKAFVQHLFLRRTISSAAGENTIRIHDVYENRGDKESPFMILYHFNLGFPFLNENTEFVIPHERVVSMYPGRTPDDRPHAAEPAPVQDEDVFIYSLKQDSEGFSYALAISDFEKRDLGILMKFPNSVLPNLANWLQFSAGSYVVGMEPCNNFINGVHNAAQEGTLRYIRPGEKVEADIELSVLEGEELERAEAFLKSL